MLVPSPKDIFFSKNDPADLRLGDRLLHSVKSTTLSAQTFALIGWPDDRGVTLNIGRAGAGQASVAIRKRLFPLVDRFPKLNLIDLGDLKIEHTLEESHQKAAHHVSQTLQKKMVPIVLGGGNDYAYGDVLGVSQGIGKNKKIGVINIDAHLDVRDLSFGLTSGTPFFRILESKLIDPRHFIAFAPQKRVNSIHHEKYLTQKKSKMMWLEELQKLGVLKMFKQGLVFLSKQCDFIYLSLDMDAVKQSDSPGVSAPSPEGLTAHEVQNIFSIAGQNKKVKMISFYETNPLFDQDDQTSRLVASCIWHFLTAQNG